MGKHKKHKNKHHSHPHGHGSKDMTRSQHEMRVVVPLQSLVEPASPMRPVVPVSTAHSQLTVSIPRTALHASSSSHHHQSRHQAIHAPQAIHPPHGAHQLHTPPLAHTSPEHKHHKKHKKKHKRHSHEIPVHNDVPLSVSQPKIAPIRLPVPKADPPHAPPLPTDSAHLHISHATHSKHHKHKHKRSRDSFEEPPLGSTGPPASVESGQETAVPKIKRPKIEGFQFKESQPMEPEKRLVTPLQIHLPPAATLEAAHKHKKKKKKHKHSKTLANDATAWEVIKEDTKQSPPTQTLPPPLPGAEPTQVIPSPKTTPIKITHPPVQTSPGKQMRLLRGLEPSIKEKVKTQSSSLVEKSHKKQPLTEKKEKPVEVIKLTPPLPVAAAPVKTKTPQVKLSENALKFFLKNLHHLVQKRDPEGVFGEPVTDDIAPNYSTIIKHPMDLATMATKIENNQYPSINEFKADFELMCNNAMMYNAPETAYYSLAKHLLSNGLQIISKETSMRPDILHGRLASAIDRGHSASPLPPAAAAFRLPPSTNVTLDVTSPFLCRLPLALLRGVPDENSNIDVSGIGEIKDQSHLTKVVVGVACEDETVVEEKVAEEIAEQVMDAAEAVKENLDVNRPGSNFCFLNRDAEGKTMLNILDPESSEVDCSKPVDLTDLSNKVRMGNNAATVLKTELPMMKATPVSYLMYGPFGSFAPAYDSAFASLSKMDSDLLLSTYGNELGVSYAHSLQQFVKGAGSFVTEMADAVLNGLTNNRHTKFAEKMKLASSKESSALEDKETKTSSKEIKSEPDKSEPVLKTTSVDVTEGDQPSTKEVSKEDGPSLAMDDPEEATSQESETQADTATSFALEEDTHTTLYTNSITQDSDTFPMDTDSRPSFSAGDAEAETTSSSFPQDEESRSSFPDSRFESHVTSPLSTANSGSGVPSVQGMDSSGSSKENPDDSEDEASSVGDSSGSSSVSVRDEDSRDSHASTESNNGGSEKEDTVDVRLQRTSSLLAELQEQQNFRLSQPPEESNTGHLLLSGPSQAELETATQVRGELASLTGQVCPRDVVGVSSLHHAMGITMKESEDSDIVESLQGKTDT